MSDLVVIGFDDEFKADEVLLTIAKLQKENLVELEDAAVVVKGEDGQIRLKQTQNLTAAGAVSGGLWGTLVGVLFLNPLLGAAVGAGVGALSGSAADIGINDDFMRELGATLQNGTSALFILVRKITADKVVDQLAPFDGKLLRTSLSHDAEEKLREMFEEASGKNLAETNEDADRDDSESTATRL